MTSAIVFFYPQPKDTQFTVREENLDYFSLKKQKIKNKMDGSQPLKLSHYFVLFCLLLKVTWCLLYLLF